VNCLHGLYLKLQLTLHVLRTNISCEPWLTLSYTLFFFGWPCHGYFRDVLRLYPEHYTFYCSTLACLMQSSGSSSDSPPSNISSHIFGTLNDGHMRLV
jgi:hypothetical protein